MRITMVGHASLVVSHGPVHVLTDPWWKGLAFNDSWAPHPTPHAPSDLLEQVTHLWISHEHPDHLSIPTLRSLPESVRSRLTVLYQRHVSPDVRDFLAGQGFAQIIELSHDRRTPLTDDLTVMSHQVGHEDSSMTFTGGGRTLLNLNDCKPPDATLRRMLRRIGPVDVLADQFSVAGWAGNVDDVEARRWHHQDALDELAMHVRIVQPGHLLPFASFMRFAHVDNVHHNAAGVSLDEVAELLPDQALAVLYPGDQWDLHEPPPDPAPRMQSYRDDRDAIPSLPLQEHPSVPFDDVMAAAADRSAALGQAYPVALLRRAVPPLVFHCTDVGRSLQFAPGQEPVEVTDASVPGVRLHSQAAHHTFAFRWGLPTLLISGRFHLDADAADAFDRLKQLGAAYSSGFHLDGAVRRLAQRRTREFLVRRAADIGPQFVRRVL